MEVRATYQTQQPLATRVAVEVSPFGEGLRILRQMLDAYPKSAVLVQALDDPAFRTRYWELLGDDLRRKYLLLKQAERFLDRWEATT